MPTILGLTKLQRKLQRLPAVARALIKSAMEQGADNIVAMMKSLVPEDTGDLKKSIGWTWGKAPKGAMSAATLTGSGDAKDLVLTIYAGDDKAYYARWVEFGTKAHNVAKGGGTKKGQAALSRGGGTKHNGSKAQPFFFTSFRANRKSVKGRITRAINKAAKVVAANGG